MSKQLVTTKDLSATMREWSAGLKDFALVEFDQQRFFKTAIMAISESTNLMECMQTPAGRESLFCAMKKAYSTGLSLNPQEGKAVIIAYSGKASYQIMKEGAIEIVMRSGDVKTIMVEMVCENDEFNITKTSTGDQYTFSPARRDRGVVDGYFCAITDSKGISHIKFMTEIECLEIRDASSTAYKFDKKGNSPWAKFQKSMCKKTVIKAAIRDLHISPSAKAQFSSEAMDFDEPEMKNITPVKTGSSQDDVVAKLAEPEAPEQPPVQEETTKKDQF